MSLDFFTKTFSSVKDFFTTEKVFGIDTAAFVASVSIMSVLTLTLFLSFFRVFQNQWQIRHEQKDTPRRPTTPANKKDKPTPASAVASTPLSRSFAERQKIMVRANRRRS